MKIDRILGIIIYLFNHDKVSAKTLAEKYDVYYRTHIQSYGWLGWAKNGESSGTAGYAKRLEAIQILLVPKGGSAPSNNYLGINANRKQAFISK